MTGHARKSFELQQPLKVAALYVWGQCIAKTLADRFKDLASPLNINLVWNFHRIAEVRALCGPDTAQRITIRILLATALLAAALVALEET